VPDVSLINKIIYTNGGTNFAKPLSSAYDICKQDYEQYDEIILYFMSDGEDSYP